MPALRPLKPAALAFPLEFFTESFSMDMLLESLSDDAFGRRHKKLSQGEGPPTHATGEMDGPSADCGLMLM